MEDYLDQLQEFICNHVENTEETYEVPEELSHVDGSDFVDVLNYLKSYLEDLIEEYHENDVL